MKPLAAIALLFAGCASRHGSETAAVERAVARIATAQEHAGKQVVKIERHSEVIARATHDATLILDRSDGKAAVILQYLRERRK